MQPGRRRAGLKGANSPSCGAGHERVHVAANFSPDFGHVSTDQKAVDVAGICHPRPRMIGCRQAAHFIMRRYNRALHSGGRRVEMRRGDKGLGTEECPEKFPCPHSLVSSSATFQSHQSSVSSRIPTSPGPGATRRVVARRDVTCSDGFDQAGLTADYAEFADKGSG